MSDARERNRLAQKAYRQRRKKKHEAAERQLEEQSQRAAALEVERDQLQQALEAAVGAPEASQPGSSEPHQPDDDEVVASFCFGQPAVVQQLTQGEAKFITLEAAAQIWKRLVLNMAARLDEVNDAEAFSHSEPYVEDLVSEAIAFMWALADHNPQIISMLSTCNVESAAQSSAGDSRDWPSILAQMELAEGQVQQLLACRRVLLRELSALTSERDTLWGQLQGIKDVEESSEGVVTHSVRVAELTERLRDNVRESHVCQNFYNSYTYTKVLSPVQVARYLVSAYPMGPDALALMTFLARQSGDPSTDELLHAARPPTVAVSGSTRSGSGVTSAPGATSGVGADVTLGVAARLGTGLRARVRSGAGSSSGAGASSSSSAEFCAAGDWRVALVQPLRLLHGAP